MRLLTEIRPQLGYAGVYISCPGIQHHVVITPGTNKHKALLYCNDVKLKQLPRSSLQGMKMFLSAYVCLEINPTKAAVFKE